MNESREPLATSRRDRRSVGLAGPDCFGACRSSDSSLPVSDSGLRQRTVRPPRLRPGRCQPAAGWAEPLTVTAESLQRLGSDSEVDAFPRAGHVLGETITKEGTMTDLDSLLRSADPAHPAKPATLSPPPSSRRTCSPSPQRRQRRRQRPRQRPRGRRPPRPGDLSPPPTPRPHRLGNGRTRAGRRRRRRGSGRPGLVQPRVTRGQRRGVRGGLRFGVVLGLPQRRAR